MVNVKDKIKACVETFVNQYNLYPISPSNYFQDLSKTDLLDLKVNQKPDILFYTSQTKQIIEEVDGIICVNTKAVMGSSASGYFGLVQIDGEYFNSEVGKLSEMSSISVNKI